MVSQSAPAILFIKPPLEMTALVVIPVRDAELPTLKDASKILR